MTRGDFILIVGHGRVLAQHPERNFCQDQLRSDALGGGLRTHARQPVPDFSSLALPISRDGYRGIRRFFRAVWFLGAWCYLFYHEVTRRQWRVWEHKVSCLDFHGFNPGQNNRRSNSQLYFEFRQLYR